MITREKDFFLTLGESATSFFTGVVEDRNDPAQMGRVRVRIFGVHPFDRTEVPTEALPWATILLPTTMAGMGGVLTPTAGIIEGTWVAGFFRDGASCQDPLVFGVIPSVASPKWTGTSNLMNKNPDSGAIAESVKNGDKVGAQDKIDELNKNLKDELTSPTSDIRKKFNEKMLEHMTKAGINTLNDFADFAENFAQLDAQLDSILDNVMESMTPDIEALIKKTYSLDANEEIDPKTRQAIIDSFKYSSKKTTKEQISTYQQEQQRLPEIPLDSYTATRTGD